VESVRRIFNYYKKFGYPTQIMGASFRKATQVTDLAGCDLLTISPTLLAELAAQTGDVPRVLDPGDATSKPLERVILDEGEFRWQHNQDAMATEKLADGIRRFDADARKLEALIAERHSLLPNDFIERSHC
jgi:transaldolase